MKMIRNLVAKKTMPLALTALALLASGCGTGNSPITTTGGPSGLKIVQTGLVYGGQQPVANAHIQLYAVGRGANGAAATPLLTTTVRTDAGGGFTLTGLWNCNDTATYGTDPLLYITATGGNPGLSSGTNNAALALMTALGPCSTLTASSYISINEVTTVAAVYALAPFLTDSTHIGAVNAAALRNAFATAATLADRTVGATPGGAMPANGSLSVPTVHTLANIIAACVNTDGAGPPCTSLFQSTMLNGVAPVDTIGALRSMVFEPTQNVAPIFSLSTPASPFQPSLAAAPKDFSIAIRFAGQGLAGPAGITLDNDQNVWVANAAGEGVSVLANDGTPKPGFPETANGAIVGSQAVTTDHAGNIWVANTALSTVTRLTISAGAVTQRATYSAGINAPIALAADAQNRIWVSNFGNGSVTVLDGTSGATLLGSPLTANGTLVAPAGIAIDSAGNAWVADNGTNTVIEFSPTGAVLSGSGFTDGAITAPFGVGIGAGDAVVVAGNGNDALLLLDHNGQAAAASPLTAAGLMMPIGVAVDAAGNFWVTSSTSQGSLARLRGGVVTAAIGTIDTPTGIVVDPSGSVWVSSTDDNSVIKFPGMARP